MSKKLRFTVLDFNGTWFTVESYDSYFRGVYPQTYRNSNLYYLVRHDDHLVTNPDTNAPFAQLLIRYKLNNDIAAIIDDNK